MSIYSQRTHGLSDSYKVQFRVSFDFTQSIYHPSYTANLISRLFMRVVAGYFLYQLYSCVMRTSPPPDLRLRFTERKG
jgi:hypothetical protein